MVYVIVAPWKIGNTRKNRFSRGQLTQICVVLGGGLIWNRVYTLFWNEGIYGQIPSTSSQLYHSWSCLKTETLALTYAQMYAGVWENRTEFWQVYQVVLNRWIRGLFKTLTVNSLTEVSKTKEAFWLKGISHAFTTDFKHSTTPH